MNNVKKYILLSLGFLSAALCVIGIFLPVVPSAPFALAAAYFFSKSSRRFHRYIQNNRWVGHIVRDWEAHHAIPMGVKIYSSAVLAILVAVSCYLIEDPAWVIALLCGLNVCALLFIWTRPTRRVRA